MTAECPNCGADLEVRESVISIDLGLCDDCDSTWMVRSRPMAADGGDHDA